MTYYLSTRIASSMGEAIAVTEAALQDAGFGVVTRIDMEQVLKAKIGADFRPYVILGACNPHLALEALQIEDKVGTMLPCNFVVQSLGGETVEVAAIDPVASMQAIDNPRLKDAAAQVRERLKGVIAALGENVTQRA